MPFSRSRSIESSTRSLTSWLARNAPDCHNMASTSVVLPWSTWATIATLRRSSRRASTGPGYVALRRGHDLRAPPPPQQVPRAGNAHAQREPSEQGDPGETLLRGHVGRDAGVDDGPLVGGPHTPRVVHDAAVRATGGDGEQQLALGPRHAPDREHGELV